MRRLALRLRPCGRAERLGVFGGTFDPVHVGHVVVAAEARSALDLDRVLLVVAGDPWQKRGRVVASAGPPRCWSRPRSRRSRASRRPRRDRARRRVGHRRHAGGARRPRRELFLVLGADAVANMATWRRLDDTRDLATVVVVERDGDPRRAAGAGWRVERVAIPRLDISSTDVRARLPPDARSTAWSRRPSCAGSRRAASTLAADDDGACRLTAAPASDAPVPAASREPARRRAAADKKGTDIVVLDVGDIISITEIFVLVERIEHPPGADDRRRGRARAQGARRRRGRPARVEGLDDATWVLMDYGDMIVHVFLAETRAYYDLDRLWADAPVSTGRPTPSTRARYAAAQPR